MSELPAPLTPADCDLQDFAFMPLDVRRLTNSQWWITACIEEPRAAMAAVNLWVSAWQQVPAASLPISDAMLARLAMVEITVWRKIKTRVLGPWIECTDGRIYHPVVAEKALEAWEKKEFYRGRSKKANDKRWGKSGSDDEHADRSSIAKGTNGSPSSNAKSILEGASEPILEGSQGRGRVREEGREGARTPERARSGNVAPMPDPPADLADMTKLAQECARVAGTRQLEPNQFIRDVELVRGWTEAGADPPLILETIRVALLSNSSSIFSLKFFDQPIRTATAKREASDSGSVPRQDHRNGIRNELADRIASRIAGRLELSRPEAIGAGDADAA